MKFNRILSLLITTFICLNMYSCSKNNDETKKYDEKTSSTETMTEKATEVETASQTENIVQKTEPIQNVAPLDQIVGVWNAYAVGDENGKLLLNEDGTFFNYGYVFYPDGNCYCYYDGYNKMYTYSKTGSSDYTMYADGEAQMIFSIVNGYLHSNILYCFNKVSENLPEPPVIKAELSPQQLLYYEYYERLMANAMFCDNGGYLFDMNNDGIYEMLLLDDVNDYQLLRCENGSVISEIFLIWVNIKNPQVYTIGNYFYIVDEVGNDVTEYYYNPSTDKEMSVNTTYTLNADNTYNASWNVRNPSMEGGFMLGMYDSGNDTVSQKYMHSEKCNTVLTSALEECGIYISNYNNKTKLDYLTYAELEKKLAQLSGMAGGSSAPEYIGYGIVNTEQTALNMRSEPNTNSQILAQIPKDTQIPIYSVDNGKWYYTHYNEKSGYVSSDYVKLLN